MNDSSRERELEDKIRRLQAEIGQLRERVQWPATGDTVRVPEAYASFFNLAEETVGKYFSQTTIDPTKATIEISGQRYVLLRASSLSVDFLATIKNLYADHGEEEAFAIGRSFLFDIAHVIGMEDAKNFHKQMGVVDPIAKLSAGPVHFAYSGWAFVDISPESSPTPDENCFLKYDHPFSFEADAWIKAGIRSDKPVCIMNAGYSSGWCEESFGVPLTAVEISCKAAGDDTCTFIMASPRKIKQHLARYVPKSSQSKSIAYQIPSFFERKRVEEEMKSARRKAEDSDRMKSEFLANMSHEIRTPMNAIIGMTELVLDTALTDVQRDYLTTSLESAESLVDIIDEILDFSKIEAGKLELDIHPFSLPECVGDTMKSLALRAKSKGLALAWNVEKDVPNMVRGDRGRLRQILVNLVGNAIKFTDHGEIEANVKVQEMGPDGATLYITIRDTGIGIPQSKLHSIFDAFTQVDMATTRRYGGTGLGLTISSELVRLMDGKIWVDSQPGQGSTFHFTVRMDTEPAKADVHADLAELLALTVTDRPTNRKILEEMLSTLGMRVGAAESAQAAVHALLKQQATGHPMQLLVTDIADAVPLVESIRGNRELVDPIIIVLTSAQKRQQIQRLVGLGVEACLTKPVKQSDLTTSILRAKQVFDARPVTSPVIASEPETLEEPEPTQPPTTDTPVRILLVEDGVANQKFAVAMLSRWGHSVTIANNGREAINALNDAPDQFDLVLMDILMPEMDGLQATEKIRAQERDSGRHIPIVAITAQAMKGDREKCLKVGMDDYLAKPLRRRELQKTIQRLVSKKA